MINKSKKNILLVSHVTRTPGMVHKFHGYLKKSYKTGLLLHPLYPTSDVGSSFKFDGKTKFAKLPFFAQYFFEMFFNMWMLLRLKNPKIDLIICFDPLSFLNIFFYKLINSNVRIVYYNLDYSKKRFANMVLNQIYQRINYFAFSKCDFFLCPTSKFTEELDPEKKFSQKSFVFPHTVDTNSIKGDIKKIPGSIVFAGTLSNTVDFSRLVNALGALHDKGVNFLFDIYGDGIFKSRVEDLLKRSSLTEVVFRGVVDNEKLINEVLPRYELAVAPYIVSKKKTIADHMFQGTDLTSKIVEYIAAGLVVVSTRLNDAFDIIEEKKFGKLVASQENWEEALQDFLNDKKKTKDYGKNAITYSKKYDSGSVVIPMVRNFLKS